MIFHAPAGSKEKQRNRTLLKDIPERDKLVLRERLQKLREVSGDGV